MSKSAKKTPSERMLTITSNSAPDFENENKSATVLATPSADMEVFVFISGQLHSKHQNRIARLVMLLWNEYQSLPNKYRLNPATLFRMTVNADKLIEAREKEIESLTLIVETKQEEVNSLTWWNKVYRASLLVILLGLITCALL